MNSTAFEPALMKIEPACRYLDVGRSKLYELIREGKLDAVKIGKSARDISDPGPQGWGCQRVLWAIRQGWPASSQQTV